MSYLKTTCCARCLSTSVQNFSFLNKNGAPKKGDCAPPSFERVLAEEFTPEELAFVETNFLHPALCLVPDYGSPKITFEAILHVLKTHSPLTKDSVLVMEEDGFASIVISARKMPACVDEDFFGKPKKSKDAFEERIQGYHAFIGEGFLDPQQRNIDAMHIRPSQRLKARSALLKKFPFLKGTTRALWSFLLMHHLLRGEVLNNPYHDRKGGGRTVLDGDLKGESNLFPLADCWDKISFGTVGDIDNESSIQLRLWVGGDVRFS